jgi:uncharacterized protein YjdB
MKKVIIGLVLAALAIAALTGVLVTCENAALETLVNEGVGAADKKAAQDGEEDDDEDDDEDYEDEEEEEDDDDDEEEGDGTVTSITLSRTTLPLAIGGAMTLTATTVPAGAAVTWSSTKPDVASVTAAGLVTALKGGTARIKAKAGKKTATCTVTVASAAAEKEEEDGVDWGDLEDDYDASDDNYTPVTVTSITLNETSLTLAIGGTAQLTATTVPAGAAVRWLYKGDAVSVDADGTVTAVKGGTAQVAAIAGGKRMICDVMVSKSPGLYEGLSATSKLESASVNLAAAFAWIKENGMADGGEYTIVLGENENDTTTTDYYIGTGNSSAATGTGSKKNLTITLRGINKDITITKTAAGTLFTVSGANAQDTPHLILENITLKGYNLNNQALVVVGVNAKPAQLAKLTMNDGSRITGNVSSIRGAVAVRLFEGGRFTMEKGSSIDNNESTSTASSACGGVGGLVGSQFTMKGGIISGNKSAGTMTAAVSISGTFKKTGGIIYGTNETDTSLKNTPATGRVIKCVDNWRDSTAGETVELDSTKTGTSGGWEN